MINDFLHGHASVGSPPLDDQTILRFAKRARYAKSSVQNGTFIFPNRVWTATVKGSAQGQNVSNVTAADMPSGCGVTLRGVLVLKVA
jgi:hypothetical protein